LRHGFSKAELGAQRSSQHDGQLLELRGEAFAAFRLGGWMALEQMPDLNKHFARDCGDGHVAIAFARRDASVETGTHLQKVQIKIKHGALPEKSRAV